MKKVIQISQIIILLGIIPFLFFLNANGQTYDDSEIKYVWEHNNYSVSINFDLTSFNTLKNIDSCEYIRDNKSFTINCFNPNSEIIGYNDFPATILKKFFILENAEPLLKSITFYNAPMGSYQIYSKEEYKYDNLQRKVENLYMKYKGLPGFGEFVYDNKFVYTFYDTSDRIDECYGFIWKEEKWDSSYYSKLLFIDSSIIHTSKFNENNEWINYSQHHRKYNSQNKLLEEIALIWKNNSWQNEEKYLYEYNEKDSLTQMTFQRWDTTTLKWFDFRKTSMQYLPDSIVKTEFGWNKEQVQWANRFKKTILKGDKCFVKNGIYYIHEICTNTNWDTALKEIEIYDSITNKIIYYENQHFPQETSFFYDECARYFYENGTLKELVYKNIFDESGSKSVYEYYNTTNVVDDILANSSEIIIFPNPASEYIEINVGARHAVPVRNEQIQISDIYGEQMYNFVGAHCPDIIGIPLRIDVSSFPNGIYFIRIAENIQKFVVLR